MRQTPVPETVRTRGGAKILNARKVAERYVAANVDASKVDDEDKDYILKLCAEIARYSNRSDLFFKVAKESKYEYTIFIANWRGKIIFTDWVETFQMEDSPSLFHNITGAGGDFTSGQVEVTVKKRGVVTPMHARQHQTVNDPYGAPPPPLGARRSHPYPVANMTPRPTPRPVTARGRRSKAPVTPRRSLHVDRIAGKTPRRPRMRPTGRRSPRIAGKYGKPY